MLRAVSVDATVERGDVAATLDNDRTNGKIFRRDENENPAAAHDGEDGDDSEEEDANAAAQ